jgi:Kef-type K+ transport system membrane component KefB
MALADNNPRGAHAAQLAGSPAGTALGYALMLAAGVGLFLAIRAAGETIPVPPPTVTLAAAVAPKADALLHVLLALAAVLVAGRALGWALARLGQPPVIGEVVAGILLGPSFLGREASAWLLPPAVAPYLGVLAQLGAVLYMFLVGLELNLVHLRHRAPALIVVSHASILVPFVLGSALALGLYPDLAHPGVPFTSFALFMGVALAITAFPVLARILTDRRLTRAELGAVALSSAAVGDVTAWCLLALAVGVARAEVSGALAVIGLALAFIGLMLVVVRPLAVRLARRGEGRALTPGAFAAVLAAVLLSALATEAIGIHAVFGAFLLGAVIPSDSGIARALTHKLESIVTVLLLPAFFAYTGMRTEIGLVSGLNAWLVCGLIILAATAGKFGGTYAAARLTGMDGRTSAALGVLMNTRGLMELIVLNIGLELGVISPTLYAMMVLMALATTLMTTPILRRLVPDAQSQATDPEPAEATVNA